MKPADEWLSAAAATRVLGVARATLYAYVSRGLVRSRPIAGTRRREYQAADLRRLVARRDARAGHGAVAAGALRWGEPVLDSAVTEIGADGPRYRGVSAVALASERASFEAVAELLWAQRGRATVDWDARPRAAVVARIVRALPKGPRPLDAMTLVLAALAPADPLRDARDDAAWRQAVVSIRALVLAIAAACDPKRIARVNAERSIARAVLVAWGRRPTRDAVRAIETALVVMADHELNPSTFAARVAASVGADLYACIGAALATVSGPEHGGMTERVGAFVAEIGRPERAAAVVHARLRRGDAMPGFGHPLYPEGDPRAVPLLSCARALAPRRVATIAALVDAMALAGAEPPTVDLGLVAIAAALPLPAGAATALFALGRSAGWIAHAIEQRQAGYSLRPRARYVGLGTASGAGTASGTGTSTSSGTGTGTGTDERGPLSGSRS